MSDELLKNYRKDIEEANSIAEESIPLHEQDEMAPIADRKDLKRMMKTLQVVADKVDGYSETLAYNMHDLLSALMYGKTQNAKMILKMMLNQLGDIQVEGKIGDTDYEIVLEEIDTIEEGSLERVMTMSYKNKYSGDIYLVNDNKWKLKLKGLKANGKKDVDFKDSNRWYPEIRDYFTQLVKDAEGIEGTFDSRTIKVKDHRQYESTEINESEGKSLLRDKDLSISLSKDGSMIYVLNQKNHKDGTVGMDKNGRYVDDKFNYHSTQNTAFISLVTRVGLKGEAKNKAYDVLEKIKLKKGKFEDKESSDKEVMTEAKTEFGSIQKIGKYYVGEAESSGEHLDVDESRTIGFYNSESDMGLDKDDNVEDIGKLSKVWDKMTSDIDKIVVKGKTEDGRKYQIYSHYDGSGIDYWLSDDYFSFYFTCSFDDAKPDGLTKKDLKDIEKGLDKVIDKVDSVIRKATPKLDAHLKDGGFMELMESKVNNELSLIEAKLDGLTEEKENKFLKK